MDLDLRPWLDGCVQAGELVELSGVSPDLEIGALTDLNAKRRGPAILFTQIPGYEGGGRLLSCSLSRARRLALALGLDPDLGNQELVASLLGKPAEWRERAPSYAPRVVGEGPVLERVLGGDDIDMTVYPAPVWHEGDGGRYLGTGCGVITRDRESEWVNVGAYRVAVHDERRLGVMIQTNNHGAVHLQRYHERGEPAPIAVTFGQHPLLGIAAGMVVPYGLGELNYVGAMAGEPVDVVEGEVTGLPIPAAAELVVEGYVHPGEVEDEGPFGEFTGYYAGGRHPRPVVRVERVYQRADPIVYGSLPGKPPFDHSYWRAVFQSSMLLDAVRAAGVPDVVAAWKHEAACAAQLSVVAIRQRYAGHSRQAGLAAASCSAGVGMGRYVVVVDDDVDVTDLEEVVWCVTTRTDPATSIHVVAGMPGSPLDPMLLDLSRPWIGSRAIVDACRPYEHLRDFPAVVSVSPDLAREVERRWGESLGWR